MVFLHVVVPKGNDKVRICLDPLRLNENIIWEAYPLPSIDQTLGQLSSSKVFTKLDCNSGLWQIESSLLTTFTTPFGKYCYNVLPFGISPASEHHQKVMKENLSDYEGTVIDIDDILIHRTDKKEHDERLREVLRRLQGMNVTLSSEKCKFAKNQVPFLGHIIDGDGIHADPEKLTAITGMAVSFNISELRRFLGMVNQFSKFSPEPAVKSKPLRELLSTKNGVGVRVEQLHLMK